MCDTQQAVMEPAAEQNHMDDENNNSMDELSEKNLKNRSQLRTGLRNSISLVILHVLDGLLLLGLVPFMLWQWISANDRVMIILKTVIEVTIELIMWIIFAGVSILMTTTFVLEDVYFRKNDTEKLKELLKARSVAFANDGDQISTRVEPENLRKEKKKPKLL